MKSVVFLHIDIGQFEIAFGRKIEPELPIYDPITHHLQVTARQVGEVDPTATLEQQHQLISIFTRRAQAISLENRISIGSRRWYDMAKVSSHNLPGAVEPINFRQYFISACSTGISRIE